MTDSLILIGKAGALAARGSLELTGQNIANAATPGYARRSAQLAEVSSSARIDFRDSDALGGVRIDGVARTGSNHLAAEARRTGADLARADAELGVLRGAQAALESADVFGALTRFEASLSAMQFDPLDGSARAVVLEEARGTVAAIALAGETMSAARATTLDAAQGDVDTINTLAAELARTNTALARGRGGSAAQATLLDRRDDLLARMSDRIGISVAIAADGTADVRTGAAPGVALVQGGTAAALSLDTLGTPQLSIAGAPVEARSGALEGTFRGIAALDLAIAELDALAGALAQSANAAQAMGTDAAGEPGAPMFEGATAATLAVVLADGGGIAAAPANAATGSRHGTNLAALRDVAATGARDAEALLTGVSADIAGKSVTREALEAIAAGAQGLLERETGVDLDVEAANLLRFQQAFQASGRVIQVAADIFDTLLAIR